MRLLIFLLLALCTDVAAQRPNVLVIVLDDVGVEKIGAYAEDAAAGPTPVLDLIADHGVLFRNAWAFPICSPMRASTLTGRWPFRHGVGTAIPWVSPDTFVMADAELTLPEVLGGLGYRTAAVGKWHLVNQGFTPDPYMHPIDFGFERHVGPIANLLDYYAWQRNDAGASGATQTSVTGYVTSVSIDDAIDVIEGWEDEPWFMWLALNAPHGPFHAPPPQLHTQGDLTGAGPPDLFTAMLEAADTEIGRLLANIRPAVLRNTYVIVLGDNGTSWKAIPPPAPQKYKSTVFEGGVNVPMLAIGPGVATGEATGLVSSIDIFQTVVDLASGGHVEPDTDSLSLLPYLREPSARGVRPWVYTELFGDNGFGPYQEERRAIRNERYKLIRRGGPLLVLSSKIDFYDLLADPLEKKNLMLQGLTAEEQIAFDALDEVLNGLR